MQADDIGALVGGATLLVVSGLAWSGRWRWWALPRWQNVGFVGSRYVPLTLPGMLGALSLSSGLYGPCWVAC